MVVVSLRRLSPHSDFFKVDVVHLLDDFLAHWVLQAMVQEVDGVAFGFGLEAHVLHALDQRFHIFLKGLVLNNYNIEISHRDLNLIMSFYRSR